MARSPRDFTTSTRFHVANKGVDGADIVGTDGDRDVFVGLIGEVSSSLALRIEVFALMSNHFHLLVDVAERDDPSGALQRIQSAYATYFNERTERSGSLFGRRFWSQPIDHLDQFLRCARYIHRNPIDIVGARRIDRYRWSSLPAYVGRVVPAPWLSTSKLLGSIRPERYLEHVIAPSVDDLIPVADGLPHQRVSLADLVAASSAAVEHEATASLLASALAVELRVADIAEIAAFQGVTTRAVRQRASRFATRRVDDERLDRARHDVLTRLRFGSQPSEFPSGSDPEGNRASVGV